MPLFLVILAVVIVFGLKLAAARSRSPVMRFQAGFLVFAGLWLGVFASMNADVVAGVLTAACAALFLLAGIGFWLERPWSRWLALTGIAFATLANVRTLVEAGFAPLPAVIIFGLLVYAWDLLTLNTPDADR